MADSTIKMNGSEIAVVGMSGRFPEAKNITEFWENLKNGKESISFLSSQEIAELDVDPELLKNPDYVSVKGGVLEDKEFFDPAFFGYSPKEADVMDPQIRIFHECAWHALEDAGYNPENYDGAIGLYTGAGSSLFWESATMLSGKCDDIGYFASGHLNNKDYLATQTAYKLNLKGPVFSVQTACSTSLVAIHLACQGLLNGECDMALAGGIRINTQEKTGYLYQEGMIRSPDGHCRAFDARAKGIVGGDGVGVVLLKTLEDALADGDNIHAVIKGTAINNDGLRKVGYTAPSIEGQAEAIRMAQQMAEIEPESVGYIEAHGSGTELGDPIEVEALKLAFNSNTKKYCAIGSVKTNIGHLDAAAGAAGFIKTVLALKHQQIPPSLNYETPNPRIDFNNSPFFVSDRLIPWDSNGYPRRAGVSSFGIGGTNAHVVLEEWTGNNFQETADANHTGDQREYQIIPLSAKTPRALEQVTENLNRYLKENKDISLAGAAYTLVEKRKRLEFKRMAVCKDVNGAIEALSNPDSRNLHTLHSKNEQRPVIFMFAGLGSQYVNMGRELYEKEPAFRDEMNRCFEILKPLTGYDIKEILYPGQEDAVDNSRIQEFEIAQLVIFCFEYALARLIMDWGVTPGAMIGYSFGEYVAAAISGVLTLEDALDLVISRGKLISALPHGAMLSVPVPRQELEPLLKDTVSIAIDNGPTCIVAGTAEDIAALEEQLREMRLICFPMGSSYALHTKLMAPVLPEFEKAASGISAGEPQIPYISNLTGTWQTPGDAARPSYWASHMAETIRFNDGIQELLKKENPLFIEIGPGRDLSAMVGRHFGNKTDHHVLNLVRPAEQDTSDLYYLLNKIGRLWLLGQQIDWQAFYGDQSRRRLTLPLYPFEKQRYWIEKDRLKNGLEQMGISKYHQESSDSDSPADAPEKETGTDQPNLQARPQLMNPYIPPRNQLENDLTAIWQRLFGFDRIGIDDNFNELGGDSLKAITLVSQLRRISSDITLKDMLENPTIKTMAALIKEKNKGDELMIEFQEAQFLKQVECIEKLNKGQNKKIFMLHPRHGMTYQFKELAQELEGHLTVYGIQAKGIMPGTKMSESPKELINDYTEQILKVQPEGPLLIAGFCAGGVFGYEIVLELERRNHKVEQYIFFDGGMMFPPKYEKRLKMLEYLPGFVKKTLGFINHRSFMKRKQKAEANENGNNNTPDSTSLDEALGNRIALLSASIFPLEIMKAPILVLLPEESVFTIHTVEDYSRMTKGKAKLVKIPGDHDSIFAKPYVERLATELIGNLQGTII